VEVVLHADRIFLSRRNFSEGGCSMKITDDVRKYAAEHGLTDAEAIESGLQAVTQRDRARPGFQKRKEFRGKCAEVNVNG
jgi:hypothetical protein